MCLVGWAWWVFRRFGFGWLVGLRFVGCFGQSLLCLKVVIGREAVRFHIDGGGGWLGGADRTFLVVGLRRFFAKVVWTGAVVR